MIRGPLFDIDYKPQFSGHETFPIRYGWLKKAYDAVNEKKFKDKDKTIFSDDSAIAYFGVGKNMVTSIRHWALVSGVLKQDNHKLTTTEFADFIFSNYGVDPYMEHPNTLWLLHWKLAGNPKKTTWYYAFNHFPYINFDRQTLSKSIIDLAQNNNWGRTTSSTIKRDVDCFIRTYSAKKTNINKLIEDSLESPLIELGLIKNMGFRDAFKFSFGEKNTLSDAVFLFALVEFWENFTLANTLSFETILYEPSSPGRVFLLNEEDLSVRIENISSISNGKIVWSETAGMKQIIRTNNISTIELFNKLKSSYN